MAILTKIMLSIAIAALTVQNTDATPLASTESTPFKTRDALNGCYSGGNTYADAGYTSEGFIEGVCEYFAGNYVGGQRKNKCISANSGFRVDIAVIRFSGASDATLSEEDCSAAITTEFNACAHGSEQDFNSFHYIIDPNRGDC